MVNPSRRLPGQAGGVTTTKSLLTWTLLLLSAAAGQSKVDQYAAPNNIYRSATAEVASSEPRRPEAGSSPAEVHLLNKDVHTAKFRNTDYGHIENRQNAPAPALEISAVRAPLAQSAGPTGLTAITEARLSQDWEADDIILLSTIDGSLHARDRRTGQHRWTLAMPDDPMIKTVHYTQNRTNQDDNAPEPEYMFIVEPSKEGQLYAQFSDPTMGLMRLQATVKKMATEGPYRMHVNGQILATSSEQQLKSYTIDAATGEILYEFPKHRASGRADPQPRCHRRRNDLELEDPACKPGRTIRLGRSVYTFTISSEQLGQDLCTITFSEWVINKGDQELQRKYVQSLDGFDIKSSYTGRMIGIDSSTSTSKYPMYNQFVESPIARIFDVIRSRDDPDDSTDLVILQRPMDLLFSHPEYQDWHEENNLSQRVYIDKTEAGQWYAMSESSYPGFTLGAALAKSHWLRDGVVMDMNGDLDEIIGVHILSGQQSARAGMQLTSGMQLTISDTPENDNSDALDDTKQLAPQEPALTPTLISNNVDTKSWGSGLIGLILGGIIVLVMNSKFSLTGGKPLPKSLNVQETEVFSLNPPAPPVVVTEKADVAEQPTAVTVSEAAIQTTLERVDTSSAGTPAHSRVQSTTSAGSPKKKSVRIGDSEENNSSDADTDDEEGSAEGAGDSTILENPVGTQPRKFKTKRGKRGGRKNNKKKKSMDPAVFDEKPVISLEQNLDNGVVQIGRLKVEICEEKCLGRGSNGTAVYPGILDGREVAVKRLIKSANNLAEKEIKHLVSSDENPHVIRYFGKEESRDFFYIALDQFTTSLDQFIEHPEKYPTLVDEAKGFDVKDCLRQITDGVQHLHSLKLVHRDIKPQNVLVRAVKSNRPTTGMPKLQFVISDFGLCKPLEDGAMSTFAPTANHTAAGTTGWRAPELLVSPRDAIAAPSAESSTSKTVSTTHSLDGTAIDLPTGRRATKAIDIFSLGCVFYYVMTRGGHPFDVGGSSLGRDLNIKENNFTTELMRFYKYEYDAEDLIMQMVNHEPKNRPDTAGVLKHPYFWTPEQKIEFLCLVSDCYEREKNSIIDIHAKGPVTRTPAEEESLEELAMLESLAPNVIGTNSKKEVRDFLQALPRTFLNGMGKQRSYTGTRMIDLLRLIRNKKNHFRDLPEDVQSLILARGTSLEEGYYGFWSDRFPALLINCHTNIIERQLTERFKLERWFG